MTISPTITVKPRRRWLQFSLRGLLLVVVVIAVLLGWMHRVRQQRDAVAALEKAGCFVGYENGNSWAPEWARRLLGESAFGNAVAVDGGSQANDLALTHLEGLTQLRHLSLTRTSVTDAGLIHLQRLVRLQSLSLTETQVTSSGLVHLKPLSQLTSLSLGGTKVSDAGLVHLSGLNRLQYLGLFGTLVTDAGLAHLKGLNQLQELDLRKTQVTVAGMQELKSALPALKFIP